MIRQKKCTAFDRNSDTKLLDFFIIVIIKNTCSWQLVKKLLIEVA